MDQGKEVNAFHNPKLQLEKENDLLYLKGTQK